MRINHCEGLTARDTLSLLLDLLAGHLSLALHCTHRHAAQGMLVSWVWGLTSLAGTMVALCTGTACLIDICTASVGHACNQNVTDPVPPAAADAASSWWGSSAQCGAGGSPSEQSPRAQQRAVQGKDSASQHQWVTVALRPRWAT